MIFRPRRLRRTAAIRDMAAETRLSPSMLVYPVFIREGKNIIEDIPAMPGQKRYSPDTFPKFLEETANAGIKSILLFGLPEHKDECGSGAWDENGVIQQALRVGKKNFPEMTFICDVCLCEYTSHGHCGLLKGETVDNDPTVEDNYTATFAVDGETVRVHVLDTSGDSCYAAMHAKSMPRHIRTGPLVGSRSLPSRV